jgi:hypothetical protein
MKFLPLGVIPAALALVACETMNAPISNGGGFDPLGTPGGGIREADTSFGPSIRPGQFVTASIPNTAFYRNKPRGSEDADKLIDLGTNMKIVSNDGNYVKVELDSGEVGWVPSVMVASSSPEITPIDGAYQVYPPLPDVGGLEPLPVIDPSGLPPEGAIPTLIDPDAPAPAPGAPLTVDPIPDLTPSAPEPAPAIPEEKTEEEKPE